MPFWGAITSKIVPLFLWLTLFSLGYNEANTYLLHQAFCHYFLSYHGPRSNDDNQLETKTSEIMRQNNIFPPFDGVFRFITPMKTLASTVTAFHFVFPVFCLHKDLTGIYTWILLLYRWDPLSFFSSFSFPHAPNQN